MTFDTNVPNAGQSPGLFPSQNTANFTRLKAMFIADHVFNDTAATNDGYHKIIHWLTQAGVFGDGTPGAVTNTGLSYTKSTPRILNNVSANVIFPMYKDPSGVEFFVAPGMNAFVNFDGSTLGTPQYIREGVNVTNVDRIATGTYRITFGSPFVTNNYVPIISGGSTVIGTGITGMVRPGAYNSVVTTTFLDVSFFSTTNSSIAAVDVTVGSIAIIGY